MFDRVREHVLIAQTAARKVGNMAMGEPLGDTLTFSGTAGMKACALVLMVFGFLVVVDLGVLVLVLYSHCYCYYYDYNKNHEQKYRKDNGFYFRKTASYIPVAPGKQHYYND